jgi:hypothetical protein
MNPHQANLGALPVPPTASLVPHLDAFDPSLFTRQIDLTRFAARRDACRKRNRVRLTVAEMYFNPVEMDGGVLHQQLNSPEGAMRFSDMDFVVVGAAVQVGLAQISPILGEQFRGARES